LKVEHYILEFLATELDTVHQWPHIAGYMEFA